MMLIAEYKSEVEEEVDDGNDREMKQSSASDEELYLQLRFDWPRRNEWDGNAL